LAQALHKLFIYGEMSAAVIERRGTRQNSAIRPALQASRLSAAPSVLIDYPDNELLFSAARHVGDCDQARVRPNDFRVNAGLLRRGLLDNGYNELPIASHHAVAIDCLRAIHKDPFDGIFLAQALTEGIHAVNDRPVSGAISRSYATGLNHALYVTLKVRSRVTILFLPAPQ
jgi:hypothetical protein